MLLTLAAWARPLVIHQARLLDHPEPTDLLLEDGKIAAIGTFKVPAGAAQFQAGGRWMLAGFIDSHVHLQLSQPRACLKGGTTTVRDLGWTPRIIFSQARALRAHGPDVLAAGGILCQPGGYPSQAGWCPSATALPVGSAAEAARAVARMKAAGACVIKVSLPLPFLSEVVAQAHRRGLKVTAHLSGLEQLDQALLAGVDELAHFSFASLRVPEDRIKRMVARKMAICPTLHIAPSPQRIDNLTRFVRAGGVVLYGTDLGNFGPNPGIDVQELEYMRQAGMTPRQVIDSATSVSAQWMGLSDRGRVAVGCRADLIVLRGNPLEDLSWLGSPLFVFYQGELVE